MASSPAMYGTGLIQPLPEISALRMPWPRLAGRIEHLTLDLEDELRFGHIVSDVGDGYRLGGSIKGGSSSVWMTVSEDVYKGYLNWKQMESLSEEPDADAFYRLRHRLASVGISVRSYPDEYLPRHGGVYRMLEKVFCMFPDEHLVWLPLEEIVIGGWGPDAAKASAYKDGRIYLYDFVIGGACRTFIGITLHEIGHAFFAALRPEKRTALENAHRIISAGQALLGTEFLLDPESRVVYQEFLVDEFVAESYMVYVAQGARLRGYISRLPGELREAWRTVYGMYLDTFGGWAYI